MNRRNFLATGFGVALAQFPNRSNLFSLGYSPAAPAPESAPAREPVLVPAGFTRRADGSEEATTSQQTVVRSTDSEGRLAAFVVPVGEHAPYSGAPLHLHHEQDEWLHVLAGEFVAEVGGKRMRLKTGDSLLMPMKIPHRWSHASQSHSGIVHLYTPAGLMDVWRDSAPSEVTPQTLEQRKSEFEKYGTTLLGLPLTKEEIDRAT